MAKSQNNGNGVNVVKMFTDSIKNEIRFNGFDLKESKEKKNMVFCHIANGSDLFICKFNDVEKVGFRNGFGIDIDEELLWARDTSFWDTKNQGMVITDRGFYFVPDNDNRDNDFFISWNNIEKVEYKDLNFIFYTHDGNRQLLGYKYFFKDQKPFELIKDFKNALVRLAGLFTKIATAVGYEEEKNFWDIISEMIDAHEYDEARQKLNENLDPIDPTDVALTNWYLGISYLSERNSLFK